MKSIKFTEKIIINCAVERVFDYTQDYSNRLKWDTFLKKAFIYGDKHADIGVKVYCVAKNGFGMEMEYVSYNRPKSTAVKMTKGPFMFSLFLGSWNFKRLEAEQTEVIFLNSFTLRFRFRWFTFLIKRKLQSNVRIILTNLKNQLEN